MERGFGSTAPHQQLPRIHRSRLSCPVRGKRDKDKQNAVKTAIKCTSFYALDNVSTAFEKEEIV